MKKIRYIIYVLAAVLCTTACKEELLLAEGEVTPPPIIDNGIGQMVLFSSGTTASSHTTRAGDEGGGEPEGGKNDGITTTPGKTYYMPDAGRFVIRMYYKANVSSDDYDVSGNTDVTTWMKVSGNVGNSLYWNKEYQPVDTSIKGKGGVDDYGNDYSATALYWQNRKKHAFLAWTDLNKLTTIPYSPDKN